MADPVAVLENTWRPPSLERLQSSYRYPDPCPTCGGFVGSPFGLRDLGIVLKDWWETPRGIICSPSCRGRRN